MKSTITLLIFILLSNFTFSQSKEFNEFILEGIETWEVPGFAVSVVKDGEVVFSEVYGVRNIETGKKVNKETMFAIGSTTKALTSFCIALLVDEGKLAFTDKVTDHYPGFQLADPYVTRELQIRDVLTHRAGLGNADYLWFMTDFKTDEIIQRMKDVGPAYSFRSDFIYQNIMYAVAGEIILKISGKPWWVFMQEKIFDPLKMNHTVTKTHLLDKDKTSRNHVVPHVKNNDGVETVNIMIADQIGSVGSVWSTIGDMAKWTKFMLDSAKIEGERQLSKKVFEELFKPQTIVPKSKFYPTSKLTNPNWTTYGYGWFQHDYQGRMVNFHTGSLTGLHAIIGLLFEDNAGVYVMGNADQSELRHAIMYKAFDLYATGGNSDWNEEIHSLYSHIKAKDDENKQKAADDRIRDTSLSHPLKEYAGKYTSPAWGNLEILFENSNLHLQTRPSIKLVLSHWHYDTFKTKAAQNTPWLNDFDVTFNFNAKGDVAGVDFRGYQFVKVKGEQ